MAAQDEYSINTGEIRKFSVVDFVLFSLVLAVSGLIGLFYAIRDRNKLTTETFMLAGKSMSVFPVSMSLVVTFLSALTLLGNPVEVYNFNTMFWWQVVSMLLAVSAAAHIFIPFFYRLKVTTVLEYLQMRFNTSVKILASFFIILQTLVYFSFILYAPSLALSSVTSVSLWGSVVGIGLVVTFYTTLGGMKAVVWTDTFQAGVIIAGLLAVVIQGSIVTGGITSAWDVANQHGRIVFDDFSFNPGTRHSVWSVAIGGGFFWMTLYGVNQAQVQRCISCSSVKKAQIALWINLSGIILIVSLCFLIGVFMFAFYVNCHPAGIISKTDQLLPLFVMDILGEYQGIPGIFVACIFSGSLSSLSSGLSAISSVTIKDLLPYCCSGLSDFKNTLLTKVSVVVYGFAGIGLAYMVGNLGSVLQASYSVYGILNGPLFGLFLLGMFFPWANSFGAFVGCLSSLTFMLWIGIGAFVNKVSTAVKSPLTTSGCVWSNISTTTTAAAAAVNTTTVTPSDPTDIPAYGIYTLSYLYYTITGGAIVVIVGLIFSFISGHRKPSTLDPRLICPLFDILFPYLPESILKPLRFGIDHHMKYEKNDVMMTGGEITGEEKPTILDNNKETSLKPQNGNNTPTVPKSSVSVVDENVKDVNIAET